MSDDTPTQRFDQQGDAPTERMPVPTVDEVPLEVAEERKSRKLMIILASIGGALLLAVLIVLVVLLTRGSGAPIAAPTESGTPSASPTPTASQTPSASPSATPTPTPTPSKTEPAPPPPPPPPTGPKINTFNATDEVLCNTQAPNPSPQYIEFTWSSSNVSQVFFGVDTDDASTAPFFTNLPPSGDTSNFPSGYDPFAYPCPEADVKYTLTVVSSNGTKVSKSVIVTNAGDTQ